MEISEAKEMGKAAFLRGVKCAPIMDKEFMRAITSSAGNYKEILKSWIAGWTAENLKEISQ